MNVDEFLGFLFPGVNGDDPNEVVAIGGDEQNNTGWEARPWRPGEVTEPGRLYYCISTVVGPASRRQHNVLKDTAHLVRTWVIVLDDVGTKIDPAKIPVQPTTKLETSPGNFQWIYKLTYPVPPIDAHNLIEALAEAGFTDGKAKRADRYMRVPGSLNTKLEVPFRARAVEHHPERQWSLARLTVAFKVVPKALGALPEELPALAAGEVDPDWDIVQELDMVKGPPARGWYPIVCPNEAQHSPSKAGGKDSSTAYRPSKGGGVFNCQHEHCKHLTTPAFREWLHKQLIPDLQAFGQRLEALVANQSATSTAGESVRFLTPDEREPGMVRRSVIEDLIHVATEDKYWSIEVGALLPLRAIDHRLYQRMVVVGLLDGTTPTGKPTIWQPQVWLKNQADTQRVGKITHRLGQPLIIDNCLNIAPPIPLPLEADGEPELWLDLVDFVCCTDEDADLVLDWMALMVSAWDEKPGWHLLLKGAHGTGKNLLLSPLKWYCAPDHWYGMTVKDVDGGFTPFLARRFITLDELMMTTRGTISTHDIYNSVKAWTARGTGFVMINEKHMKPYAALDLSGWGITSNAEVPLPLELGDRRWLVIETPRAPRSEDYYKRVVAWLDQEDPQGATGNAIVVAWLQRRWAAMSAERREVVRGTAPMTAAKRELIINSAEGIEGAVRLAIDGTYGDAWPDLMSVGDVQNKLRGSDLMSEQAKRAMTTKRIAMALKAAGAVQMFDGKPVEDSAIRRTVRLWCLREAMVKAYQELGQGKALIDEYDRQRGGNAPGSALRKAFLRVVPSDT